MSLRTRASKIAICMMGLPGAGKTTTNKIIRELVEKAGGQCMNCSFDKWTRKGVAPRDIPTKINQELKSFNSTPGSLKVIIVDLCNERGVSNTIFNFDLQRNGYDIVTFCPNFYPESSFDDFRMWCLSNVLFRPIPGPTDTFSLTPGTAGVNVCVDVHCRKAADLATTWRKSSCLFIPRSSLEGVRKAIQSGAEKYSVFLKTHDLRADISALLAKKGLI